jgi:hypothetical protein
MIKHYRKLPSKNFNKKKNKPHLRDRSIVLDKDDLEHLQQ